MALLPKILMLGFILLAIIGWISILGKKIASSIKSAQSQPITGKEFKKHYSKSQTTPQKPTENKITPLMWSQFEISPEKQRNPDLTLYEWLACHQKPSYRKAASSVFEIEVV